MKTYVTMKIEGRVTLEVDVDEKTPGVPDETDLRKKATAAYEDADFGALEDVEMDFVNYETEDGKHVDLD